MKTLFHTAVLILFLFTINYIVTAQSDPVVPETITKTETKTFSLPTTYQDGTPKLFESITMNLESQGTLVGNVTCQYDSDVIDFYKHITILINQKDKNNNIIWKKSEYSKDESASISYSVTENDIANGNEFIISVKLYYHQGKCNGNLNVTFSEPVITSPNKSRQIEKVQETKPPLPVTRKRIIPTRKPVQEK